MFTWLIKDVVFTEDSTSMEDDLEMHPSGRNDPSMVVEVDQFFNHILRSVKSKWEITKLQFMKQKKDRQTKCVHLCPAIIMMRKYNQV